MSVICSHRDIISQSYKYLKGKVGLVPSNAHLFECPDSALQFSVSIDYYPFYSMLPANVYIWTLTVFVTKGLFRLFVADAAVLNTPPQHVQPGNVNICHYKLRIFHMLQQITISVIYLIFFLPDFTSINHPYFLYRADDYNVINYFSLYWHKNLLFSSTANTLSIVHKFFEFSESISSWEVKYRLPSCLCRILPTLIQNDLFCHSSEPDILY